MAKKPRASAAGRPTETKSTTIRGRGAKTVRAVIDDSPDIPRWVPPVVFALATVLLFPEVFFAGNHLFGTDTIGLSYFARNFYTDYVRNMGAFPLWDPTILGGLPFIEGMHGDIFYPPSLALFFLSAERMWAWKMVLHIFLAGVFAFIWLRRGLGLRRGPALFGGLVYMMGADLVTLVMPGGDGKLFVSALAPLVFWLAERAVSGRRIADFAGFALGITLIVLTSHMQAAYFCVWGVSLYFIFRIWQTWRAENGAIAARLFGMFALAGVLGMGAAAIQFLPPLEYLRNYSVRVDQRKDAETAYLESASFSLNAEEIVSLVVPEFIGYSYSADRSEGPYYWGRNPLKLNHEFAGLIALLLIPVLFLRRRSAQTWFFTGLAILTLIYALGANTPLFRLFYLIPGVKLFRAPSIIIFLYGLSVATLGALALQRLLDWRSAPDGDEARAVTRYMWIMLGVIGVFALAGMTGGFANFWVSAVFDPATYGSLRSQPFAANLPRMKFGFVLLLLFAGAVVAWWRFARKGAFSSGIAVALIVLLAGIDLYRADRPFITNTVTASKQLLSVPVFKTDESMQYLIDQAQGGKHIFRVANVGFAYHYSRNALALHGIEQVGGLHGNELGRYVQLMGIGVQETDMPNVLSSARLLDLFNTEYLVAPSRLGQLPPTLKEVAKSGASFVYRNEAALPRAFLVGRTQVMPDERALTAMTTNQIDFRTTAVVAEPLPAAIQPDPQGTVEWTERNANRQRLRVTSDKPALLVISDNWYPAIHARIDGNDAAVHRVNYTFRGITVPAGTSEIEVYYSTDHLKLPAIVSILVTLLLGGAVIGGLLRGGPGGSRAAGIASAHEEVDAAA